MKDNELRGLVLRKFYDLRRRGSFQWAEIENEDEFFKTVGEDLFRICEQLSQRGLIDWDSMRDGSGHPCGGRGQISAYGVDVVFGSLWMVNIRAAMETRSGNMKRS